MADNYLENRYEDYLKKKAAWERKKSRSIPKPADEGSEQDT